MLSDYINSCESIRKAMGGVINRVSETVVCTRKDNKTTCVTVVRYRKSTSTKRKTTPVSRTNRFIIIKRCKSSKFTFCTGNTCVSLSASMCETTVELKCILKEFCGKVKSSTNNTCKVLKEIKECKCECDNICVSSDEICKKFIKETMEYCEKEARDLIIQLNEDISPQLLNTIVLRFIGLLLYLRIIQEFSLLRDNFTNIIKNLETCYNTIKSCTCGTGNKCCSIKGKCLCSIFYKLFKATVSLHDRYCKIISYMKGESDEDLYKVIPSLSLTRSIILLTSYFNDYIRSDYMVEGSSCGCGKNENKDAKDCNGTQTQQQAGTANGNKCCCHKYSSKLDDVVTLLLEAIEDTDDCDGILSDVISMMSPLVEDKCVDPGKVKTQTSEINTSITKEKDINDQLQTVNTQKKKIKGVINGINGESNCDKNGASDANNTCAICSDTTKATPSAVSQDTQDCSGNIDTACKDYIKNGDTNGCGGSTKCNCGCDVCRGVKVECIMST